MPQQTRPSSIPPEPSEGSPSGVVERPPPKTEDLVFVNALSVAGLMDDLRAEELAELSESLADRQGSARRIEFLERYYGAGGDAARSRSRRLADRFFIHKETDAVTASGLVTRLSETVPELGEIALERIGSDDGPLVLRCGESFVGVEDDADFDTDEIDLADLEEPPTITVRGLVRGFNVLLRQAGVRWRLVELQGDLYREAYLAIDLQNALALCEAEILEEQDPEELVEQGGW